MRACHRGAYEHLWAEQKYAILAASFNSFRSGASRFSPLPPQWFGFLAQLARTVGLPRVEWQNALLHVFDHLRPHLGRAESRRIIEGILHQEPDVQDEMYRLALAYQEISLFGCRVFFPPEGFFKLWDPAGSGILWVVLGPFLGLFRPVEVLARLRESSDMNRAGLLAVLDRLRTGMPRTEYETLPLSLRQALHRHNAVALPGTRAFLHPRVPDFRAVAADDDGEPEVLPLYVLERFWDEHPQRVPGLPSEEEWLRTWREVVVAPGPEDDARQAWTEIREAFIQQAQREQFKVDRLWTTHATDDAGASDPDESVSDPLLDESRGPNREDLE